MAAAAPLRAPAGTRFLPLVFEVHGGCTADTAREIRHLLNAWSEQNGYDETVAAAREPARVLPAAPGPGPGQGQAAGQAQGQAQVPNAMPGGWQQASPSHSGSGSGSGSGSSGSGNPE